MSLHTRLTRLERCCPRLGAGCPPGALVLYRQDDPAGEPVLVDGQVLPTPCPQCGREPPVIAEVLVVVDGPQDLAPCERSPGDG
jgi:hypothetical protein